MGAASTSSGPCACANEIRCPDPSRMTTITPANDTARPAARRRENRSWPIASAIASVIPGAEATTTLAVPAVVRRSPALSDR